MSRADGTEPVAEIRWEEVGKAVAAVVSGRAGRGVASPAGPALTPAGGAEADTPTAHAVAEAVAIAALLSDWPRAREGR